MKSVIVCGVVGGLAFVLATYMQLQGREGAGHIVSAVIQPAETRKKAPEKKFPEDLAPAAQARPVAEAKGFAAADGAHRMAILHPDGRLHPWHENLGDDWRSFSVEGTELVLIVGKQQKKKVGYMTYPNNAPPVTSYRFALEVSVVDPRTGKIYANRTFLNEPRPIRQLEAWETTQLGREVAWGTVRSWLEGHCRNGWPEELDRTPIVNVVE